MQLIGTHGVEMKHPGTVALHQFWTSLRAGRDAPYRAEVTAQSLGRALVSQVFILEAAPGAEMRFRLSGTGLHDLFGMELRGMSALAVMDGESRARFADLAADVLDRGAVGVAEGVAAEAGVSPLAVEFVLTPLRSDFGRIDRLLGAVHVLDSEEAVAPAARRCRLHAAGLVGVASERRRDEALPGFAEAQAGFSGQRPALSVAGGADTARRGHRRRDHLRLVKD